LALLAVALWPAPALHAQTTTVSNLADYAGPRYPGGPDSLRALVGRSTRQAGAAPAGHALVQFELMPHGQPIKYSVITPPGRANKPLAEAAAGALRYLEAHMPAWQPAPPDPAARANEKPNRVSLVLDFATPTTAQPYEYADQNPVFGTLLQQLPERERNYVGSSLADSTKRAQFQSSVRGLSAFCQMQVRYPPAALRAHEQGTVYASFEVEENGTIVHPEILSSVGRSLDDEVLRVLALLPVATAPAQLRGQPVRVRYVLPLTFIIR
jgi:protein TonB